jgi:hypothetical protein
MGVSPEGCVGRMLAIGKKLKFQIEIQQDIRSVQEPRLRCSKSFVPSFIILPDGDTLNLLSAQFESIVEMLGFI